MSENRPFSGEFQGGQSQEFDPTNYPDELSCKVIPSLDGQTVAIEVQDVWDEEVTTVEGVPIEAVTTLPMPRILAPNIPSAVRETIDNSTGIGILRCRKEEIEDENIEDLDSPIAVMIPTISGDVELWVRRRKLSRKV